jgi:sugar lactone lactonase YvrE
VPRTISRCRLRCSVWGGCFIILAMTCSIWGQTAFYISNTTGPDGPGGLYAVSTTGALTQIGPTFFFPSGLACDASGNFYICTSSDDLCQIYKISPAGNATLFAAVDNAQGISGLAFDNGGNLYVGTQIGPYRSVGEIVKIAPDGTQQVIYSSNRLRLLAFLKRTLHSRAISGTR